MRRLCTESSFERVISFSAKRLTSTALALVVTMRSCSKRTVIMLRMVAFLWAGIMLSLLNPILCFIALFLLHGQLEVVSESRVVRHAQAEVPFLELVLDLLQRFLPEIPRLRDIVFRLAREVADRLYIGVLQAVRAADGKLQLLDRSIEDLPDALFDLVALVVAPGLALVEVHEYGEVVLGDLGGLRERV